jgi:hypothetical protein
MLGIAFTTLWLCVAGGRVFFAHNDLVESHGDRLEGLTLKFRKSLLPVLKRPWRSDIRLYYYAPSNPPFSDPMADAAWACRDESGEWGLKVWQ